MIANHNIFPNWLKHAVEKLIKNELRPFALIRLSISTDDMRDK